MQLDKQTLKTGMLLKVSIGTGKHGKGGRWSSIIRVLSVNTMGKQKIVTGIQYKTLATRGGDHHAADYFEFRKSDLIQASGQGFDGWCEAFNVKILV